MVNVPAQYQSYVTTAAQKTGLPVSVVAAQINDESGFNPAAVSSAGAQGIAQFEPATFAEYGHGSPFNVADAFGAYTAYMSALLKDYKGNVADALAAYNAGTADSTAGQQYASSILAAAGQTGSLSSTPAGSSTTTTGTGSGGSGSYTFPALSAGTTLTAYNPLNPFDTITRIWKDLTGIAGTAQDIPGAINTFTQVIRDIGAALTWAETAVEWFFVPSHWVRIACGAGGVITGVPGAYALLKAGQGSGDVTLALGILLTMVSGVLLFVAFHNIPDSVNDLQKLLAWMSDGIKSGKGTYATDTSASAGTQVA